MTDPRVTWKLGGFIAVVGAVVSLVMLIVERDGPRTPGWTIGAIGFGAVAVISIAGLLVTRKRG